MVELNKEQQTELYRAWSELGAKREQERVIEIIQTNKNINSDQAFFLVQAIKGEQK